MDRALFRTNLQCLLELSTFQLWCTHHEPSKVEYACRLSLKNLGLDYVDLYLMHNPVGFVYKDDSTFFTMKEGSGFVATR